MKIIKDAFIIGWMKFYPPFKTNPFSQLVLVSFFGVVPVFLMVTMGGGTGRIPQAMAGALVAMLGFMSINAILQDLFFDKYIKLREMMVSMPINPISYSFGVALSSLLYALPGLLLFTSYLLINGSIKIKNLPLILLSLILCWACLSSLGFTIATYLTKSTPATIGAVSNLLGILFVFVPPVYYPKEILGRYAYLALFIPTSNAASLVRGYLNMAPLSRDSAVIHWSILLVLAVLFTFISVRKAKWRED